MSRCEFDAEIKEAARGGAWIEIPKNALDLLGATGRIKVKATFNGVPYRGSIVTMGGVHVLGVQKAIREATGKTIGDPVHVVLEQDQEARDVDVPPELAAALIDDPAAKAFFESLSYTHRREYAEWIAGAKRAETRERRVREAVGMLHRGEKSRA